VSLDFEKYLHIITDVIPGVTEQDLKAPIKQSGIDSIDVVAIRVALEKHFNIELSDTEWYLFKSLEEALVYFVKNKTSEDSKTKREVKSISTQRNVEIRMPQMANSGLSEGWLLKEMGDIHWSLLSHGLEQRSSDFSDGSGNRLYATFVRLKYSLNCLSEFSENDDLILKSEIKRFGNSTYISDLEGSCNSKNISAQLMTIFSVRETGDNSSISAGELKEHLNHIEELVHMPELFNEYRLLKKNLIEEVKLGLVTFELDSEVLFSTIYQINPYTDINGLGLLYFASYPIISDFCMTYFVIENINFSEFFEKFHTIDRDIIYFANCNAGDNVVFKLKTFRSVDSSIYKIATELYRQSDGALMAKIFTVKATSVKH